MRTLQALGAVVYLAIGVNSFAPVSRGTANHHILRYNNIRTGLDNKLKIVNLKLFAYQENERNVRSGNPFFDPLDFSQSIQPAHDTDEGELSVWAARGLLLIVAILWGTNFASVKYLENLCFSPPCVHPPSEAALARFGLAAAVSIPFLINQRKDIILGGLECGVWVALGYCAQALALSTISAGKCAFICSLTVVVVPLLSAIFLGKDIKPVHLVSGFLAIIGIGMLEGMVDFKELLGLEPALSSAYESSSAIVSSSAAAIARESTGLLANPETTFGISKGDLLALGQPFGFGLAFMRIEHYVEKFKDVDNRIMTLSAAQCVAVGILSLGWVFFDFHGTIPNMQYMIEPHRMGAIAWTGLVTTLVAIYLEGFALQILSATEAAITFASEPVWASLFGAWLLHETLNINSYIGGSVILGSCLISAVLDDDSSADVDEN